MTNKTEDLVAKLHTAFPDLSWSSHQVLTEGWDHVVVILDERMVFRFPIEADYQQDLATEIKVLTQIEPDIDAAIPRYTWIAPDKTYAGYPIVPGQTVTKQYFDSFNTQQRTNFARHIAAFLSTLHARNDLSYVREDYLITDQAEVKQLSETHLPDALSDVDMQIVRTILDEVDQLLSTKRPIVFIHGDFYSRHLLWDEPNEHLGVIDFSDMCLADPAMDFAELFEYGDAFVQEVYEYYAGPKDSEFLNRAWVFQKWTAVYMLTDHFLYHKTSFAVARETFDRIKRGRV